MSHNFIALTDCMGKTIHVRAQAITAIVPAAERPADLEEMPRPEGHDDGYVEPKTFILVLGGDLDGDGFGIQEDAEQVLTLLTRAGG